MHKCPKTRLELGQAIAVCTDPIAGVSCPGSPDPGVTQFSTTGQSTTQSATGLTGQLDVQCNGVLVFSGEVLPGETADVDLSSCNGGDTVLATYQTTDSCGSSDAISCMTTVSGGDSPGQTNSAPIVISPQSDQIFEEGESVNLDVGSSFMDPDGDILEFTQNGLPGSLSLGMASGIIAGQLQAGESGSSPYAATVTASDGQGGMAACEFFVIVNDPLAGSSDLATTIELPDGDVVDVDDFIFIQIMVENLGPDNNSSVSLTAPIAAGITFISTTQTTGAAVHLPVYGDNGAVLWSLGNVAAGAFETMIIRARVDQDQSGNVIQISTNRATGQANDPTPTTGDILNQPLTVN